ncbi:hypothetical protein NHX12_029059, partial [Muraenolepis orangiensis]
IPQSPIGCRQPAPTPRSNLILGAVEPSFTFNMDTVATGAQVCVTTGPSRPAPTAFLGLLNEPAYRMQSWAGSNWDPQVFSRRFDLGEPVAAMQFLTKNYKD